MSTPAAVPRWDVHVATAGMTVVRFGTRSAEAGEGWALPRLLTEAARLGAEREGPPRAVGSGAGVPLIHSAELRWQGCEVHAEAHQHPESGAGELVLELPAWDELSSAVPGEPAFWELVDVAAMCAGAEHGCIGDGEALELQPPRDAADVLARCRRHAGVLVSDRLAREVPASAAMLYRRLEESGLVVLLH